MVQEMLYVGIIQPIQSDFSTPVVMVHKREGSWCMRPYYRELNKMTIKISFLFPLLMNYEMYYREKFSLPSWISVLDNIKSE